MRLFLVSPVAQHAEHSNTDSSFDLGCIFFCLYEWQFFKIARHVCIALKEAWFGIDFCLLINMSFWFCEMLSTVKRFTPALNACFNQTIQKVGTDLQSPAGCKHKTVIEFVDDWKIICLFFKTRCWRFHFPFIRPRFPLCISTVHSFKEIKHSSTSSTIKTVQSNEEVARC